MVYYCRLVKETGVYLVEFPDVPNAITSGHSIDEALFPRSERAFGKHLKIELV
jgi:predicted RNase H-like HicB family nuclease